MPLRFLFQSDGRLWLCFFVYTAAVAAAVQGILLPYLLPHLHWGAGLLRGTDATFFHQLAEAQAQLIRREGWGVWLLSPLGQAPAGLASAWYALLVPRPWVLIPLSAALHAGAGLALFKILSVFEPSRERSLPVLAALPLVVFPSAAFWYAQIHKDGWFLLGNLLFLYGWVRWVRLGKTPAELGLKTIAGVFGWWALAFFAVSLVRPYWNPVLFGLSLLYLPILVLALIFDQGARPCPVKRTALYGVLTLGAVAAFGLATQHIAVGEALRSEDPGGEEPVGGFSWTPTPGWPAGLDSRLAALAYSRHSFLGKYPQAGTNIDPDRVFKRAGDVLAYVPRALYLGFAMPTAAFAFQPGVNPGGSQMRWITGLEMAFLTCCYPFLLWALWTWRKRPAAWLLLLWALSGILVFTLAVPNLGALYRFRYGFLTSLAALGLLRAGLVFRSRRRGRP